MVIFLQDRLLPRYRCLHDPSGDTVAPQCEECIAEELEDAEGEWWEGTTPFYWRFWSRFNRREAA